MRFTKEELDALKNSGKCTIEDANVIFEDIKTMLNEGRDYTYACKYYSIFCQILPYMNCEHRIKDLITIGNEFLEKNLLEAQKASIYYGLMYLYHKFTFAPKVVEYGLAFLNSMCDKDGLAILSVNNSLSIILKESGFYKEAYECIKQCSEQVDRITELESDYMEIVNSNNSCYILIKMEAYEEAFKCKDKMEMLLNRNIDNPMYKGLAPAISFTSLYVKLYGQNTKHSINEYIKIMDDMIENCELDGKLKQSIEPHIGS